MKTDISLMQDLEYFGAHFEFGPCRDDDECLIESIRLGHAISAESEGVVFVQSTDAPATMSFHVLMRAANREQKLRAVNLYLTTWKWYRNAQCKNPMDWVITTVQPSQIEEIKQMAEPYTRLFNLLDPDSVNFIERAVQFKKDLTTFSYAFMRINS